jgi:iron(III) transport system substrate-binding protein
VYTKRLIAVMLISLLALALVPVAAQDDDPGVLNLYSSRHYGAMEGPFVAFERDTGIELRVTDGSPRDLLARLDADIQRGGRSVADVFLAIDAGVLGIATERGLLQPISEEDAPALYENIAPELRDPDGHWFGLSIRARTVVYNPENVTEDEIDALNTYADLADPVWEGRVCMRPASHIYTVSLFSSLINNLGVDEATTVAEGIASNVTRYINSDTSQIRAVAAGECDVAFVNHYYMGRLGSSEDPADQEIFEAVELKWMNQGEDEAGVFFNINGAGVVTNARNYENAVTFIEYMAALENQGGESEDFPGSNWEYPTNAAAELNEVIATFGEFEYDTGYALWTYGDFQQASVEMLESVDFGFSEN